MAHPRSLGSLVVVALLGCVHPPPARPVVASTRAAPPRSFDRDGDGLVDAHDRCPEAAEDRDAFEDDDGCPDPDNDRDAIVDACDRCPDSPEIYGLPNLMLDGCPDEPRRLLDGPPPPSAPATNPPTRALDDDGRCPDGSTPRPVVSGR